MNETLLYYQALGQNKKNLKSYLLSLWSLLLCTTILYFCLKHPYCYQMLSVSMLSFVDYVWLVAILFTCAALTVESIGYLYHANCQHISWLSNSSFKCFFKYNNRDHWMHHMIFYPVGPSYAHAGRDYETSESSGLTWYIPAVVFFVIYFLVHGIHIISIIFVTCFIIYAKCILDWIHNEFHYKKHWWDNKLWLRWLSSYFEWLNDIHKLHHWNQHKNFTIVYPLFDMLCGSYMAPKNHKAELEACKLKQSLSVSDFLNWHYLITGVKDAEYSKFVCLAERYPHYVLIKLDRILSVLKQILNDSHDETTQYYYDKTISLIKKIHHEKAVALLNKYTK